MSLQHVPYAQHRARLSLVAEAPSPRPDQWEHPKRILHIQSEQKEKRRSQYTQEEETSQAMNGLPERTNSETELFAPIRRRSLLQHGIATRTSWVENDGRQSLPSQMPCQASREDIENYYYNPAKPTSSPLSSIAAMAPRLEDNSPGPRTMTPNDLDYGHIGAFKLGSLRITNGTASPSPSLDMSATRSGKGDHIVDGRSSSHSHRPFAPRSNTISTPQEIIRKPWTAGPESPLRQAFEPEDEEPLRVNTHLPLPEFSAFNFNTESPTKSLDLARGYMEDLALSPFSFDNSPPRTPRLEATSKHTAMEDDLFEVEPEMPEIEEMHPSRSFDSAYQVEDAQAKIAVVVPRDLEPKPLAKADSGYSSNVSLRSFKGVSKPAVPAKEGPPTPPKEAVSRHPVSRVASSAYSITSSYSEVSEATLKTKRSLPALPSEEIPPPFRQAPPVPLQFSYVQESGKDITAPALPPKSPEQEWAAASTRGNVVVTPNHARHQSMPAIQPALRSELTPSHSPSGSTGSESSINTSRWRKEKKRPQSMQPPQPVYTVQAFRSVSEELSIPPVPADVSRHLEERVDCFPVSCFPNTIAGTNFLKRTVSKETLGTIFSVGSAEYREEPTFARLQSALPAVPVHATIPELPSPSPKPEASRRHTFQPSTPASPSSASSNRSRQSFHTIPRKATASTHQQSQHKFEDQITSYESVPSSIGKSPYDIPLGPLKSRPTPQERAKSMTSQLEAEARSRFVLARCASDEFLPTTQPISTRKSWESQAPASSPVSILHTRKSRPIPAHSRWSGIGSSPNPAPRPAVEQQRSNPNFTDDVERRCSMQSKDRVKSPPPVSMQTRKAVPMQVAKPTRTPPSPPPQPHKQDPWANQKSFWAERRKSAGEALQGRKVGEMRRPATSRTAELEQPTSQMKSRGSWDASQQWWDGYSGHPQAEYDHTYGSYSNEPDKDNWAATPYHPEQHACHQKPEEYYDGPSYEDDDFQQEQEQLPQTIHMRQTSTSEMLVLDRYSGGLGYGYEPGVGLGGSAGTRNTGKLAQGGRKSVDVSQMYGVDFSDVPVFLQRVRAEA